MIYMSEPEISPIEQRFVMRALQDNQISGKSRWVQEFEEKFADFIGTKYAIGCSNGSVALIQILTALGVKEGHEVMLPSQQIATTAFAVSTVGATVCAVDVNEKDWTIDIDKMGKAITCQTKAVVATPIYIGIPDMDGIYRVLQKDIFSTSRKVWIIEDFSEAIGSRYYDNYVGSIGDVGYASLYANKSITAGEGGVIVTNDGSLAKEIRLIGDCSFGRNDYFVNKLGYNFRFNGLCAAFALGQLSRRDYLFNRRREINGWYRKHLSPSCIWQEIPINCEVVPWMNAILCPAKKNQELVRVLQARGVESRPFFPPIGSHQYYANQGYPVRSDGEYVSKDLWKRGIILPSSGEMLTEQVVEHICSLVNECVDSV